jgi:hypothetical protein
MAEKAEKHSYKWYKERSESLGRHVARSQEFIADSEGMLDRLQRIFEKLDVHPVLIGGMALRLLAEPTLLTEDFDFLFSLEDCERLRKDGYRYGINVRLGHFTFEGQRIEVVKEGDVGKNGKNPHPDVVRDRDMIPSVEGLFMLKLISMRPKDREHMARLFPRLNEEKLRRLIDGYGGEELWKQYEKLKEFWTS